MIAGLTEREIRAIASRCRLPITDAQVARIARQGRVYESPGSDCAGLHHLHLAPGEHAPRSIAAHFHYLHRGLPQDPGLEVTVFADDGSVLDTQDYG